MQHIAPEQLFAAAKRLNLRWHANAADTDDCIVAFENPDATYFEHLCHELSHAILLGIMPGPHLADRVEKTLENFEASELNETHAFAVTMGVFDSFGLPYDESDMVEANAVQVGYSRRDIPRIWSEFRCQKEYSNAVDRIANIFLEETSSTSTVSSIASAPVMG